MYSTYIYGTPLGFDFYEDVASLKDYFKAFYISSRTGSRLMVNRRADGVTFYNYLRYDLVESGNRPRSFFGMTVAMAAGEYARNFKEVLDWFDYLFDMLVKRGTLFIVHEGGKVQYRVAKFAEAAAEVEWLKGNIPNLFMQSAEVGLVHYDASFQASTSGQIGCFNDATPETKILDAFRKYCWVAVSSVFKPEEAPIEISPAEIEDQLNSYTKQMLNIAMDPHPEHRTAVRAIADGCDEIVAMVRKYLKFERDEDDKAACDALILSASDCMSKAAALLARIPERPAQAPSVHKEPAPARKCQRCGKEKPLSAFENAASQLCSECASALRQRRAPQMRRCEMCGEEKPLAHFNDNSHYCDECLKERQTTLPVPRLPLPRINVSMSGVVVAALALVIVLIVWRPWVKPDEPITDDNTLAVSKADTIQGMQLKVKSQLGGSSTAPNLPSSPAFIHVYKYDENGIKCTNPGKHKIGGTRYYDAGTKIELISNRELRIKPETNYNQEDFKLSDDKKTCQFTIKRESKVTARSDSVVVTIIETSLEQKMKQSRK